MKTAPLTFDLPVSLANKLDRLRSDHGFGTTSEAVRFALSKFDLGGFASSDERNLQLSVRFDGPTRKGLKKAARAKDVSIGAILRAAINAAPKKKR